MPEATADAQLALLMSAVDALDQGLAVFDANLALSTWNRRVGEMLNLTEGTLCRGTMLDAVLRHAPALVAAARGREVCRLAHASTDGRQMELAGVPLAEGGYLCTCTEQSWRPEREAELQQRELELAEKSRVLEVVVENIRHGIFYVGADLKLVLCNRKFLELTDCPEEMGAPGTPFELYMRRNAERGEYGPGNIDDLVRERMDKARHPVPHRFERARGDGAALEVIGSPLEGGGFVTTFTDITERKHMERELRESEARLRAILEASPIGVAVSEIASGRVLFCNQRLADLLKARPEELLAVDPASCFVDQARQLELVRDCLKNGSVMNEEVELRRPDGSSLWALLTMRPINFNGGEALLSWVYDISELRRVRLDLDYLAHHDVLSGLPNRRGFTATLRRAVAKTRRNCRGGALLFIDLDGFKAINDRHGHDVGDWLLAEVAERMRSCLREYDLAARLGGDEFAVLVEDMEQREDAVAIAEKLRQAISQPYTWEQAELRIGASIGVSFFDNEHADPDLLLRQADAEMYRAKSSGKGRVCALSG